MELNNKEFKVKVKNPRQFTIGDTTKFGKYTSVHPSESGNQVIIPKKFHYDMLLDAMKKVAEKTTQSDPNDWGRDQQVVLIFLSYQKQLMRQNPTKYHMNQSLHI